MTIHVSARANIALTKYWGKSDRALNLPAVPSLSLTLDALETETSVSFIDAVDDYIEINGAIATGRPRARVVEHLDRFRAIARSDRRLSVVSTNRFPTAAGLASSASGFAALTVAVDALFELGLNREELSSHARRASASAARSVFGGFVELPAGSAGDDSLGAREIVLTPPWELAMLIAIVSGREKATPSTEGMERTRETSPFYRAWVEAAPGFHQQALHALAARDLHALGRAMERSTFAFHASAMAADPPIVYLSPSTLSLIGAVHALREKLPPAYMTMDAGPNLILLVEAPHAERWLHALRERPEIESIVSSGIGEEARIVG